RAPLRGREARPDQALLLVELARLCALAHGSAEPDPGAGVWRLRAGLGAVRRPHQGLPPQVALRRSSSAARACDDDRLAWLTFKFAAACQTRGRCATRLHFGARP